MFPFVKKQLQKYKKKADYTSVSKKNYTFASEKGKIGKPETVFTYKKQLK
jgi:hypothetical protein